MATVASVLCRQLSGLLILWDGLGSIGSVQIMNMLI
jgi:hypothetical protein